MLDSGMTFVEAYSEAIQIPSNIHISEKIESNIRDLYEGASVSKIFMSLGLFSNDLIALIQAGQQSGRLSYAFIRCAQSLEYNLDHKLKRLTSLLEPALMISMGIIIGSIALSIMLPIYEMSKSLQK
jgi:type IV pilus assembly protein PilC